MLKKLLAMVLSMIMVLSMLPFAVLAGNFSDMPGNWSAGALQNAVKNGLIQGSGNKIMPNDNVTRAQMAAVIVRAFGENVKGDITTFTDIPKTAWYKDDMAKAFQMGVIKGENNKLNPDKPITREEVFAIVTRALKLTPATTLEKQFADASEISSWAKGEVFALVNAGYVSGSGGRLNPKANITRAEFSVLFDNIIKQYIKAPGIVKSISAGNIMINVSDVTLKGVTVQGDLIIGDGVGNGNVTLEDVRVTGRTLVRGGGTNSIVVKGKSTLGIVIIARNDGPVALRAEGTDAVISKVEVQSDGALITAPNAEITVLASVKSAVVNGKAVTGGTTIKPSVPAPPVAPAAPAVPATPAVNPPGGGDNPPPAPNVPVTGVTLNITSASIIIGQKANLTATVNPGNATNKAVVWSSNDTMVATVSNGTVTATGNGTAIITATTADGGFEAQCVMSVAPAGVNSTFRITEPGTYSNATYNNVVIDSSVGNGTIRFNNVIITGNLTINGGGSHTIGFDGTTSVNGTTTINRPLGQGDEVPRLELTGPASLGEVNSETAATIEASVDATGSIGIVTANAPTLITNANVTNITANSGVTLDNANVGEVTVPGSASNPTIALTGSTNIGSVAINSSATLSSSGTYTSIGTVNASAPTTISGTAGVATLQVTGAASVNTASGTSISNITVGSGATGTLMLAGPVNSVTADSSNTNITVAGNSAPTILGTVGTVNVSGGASPIIAATANSVTLQANNSGNPPSVTVTGAVPSISTTGTGAVGTINIGGSGAPQVTVASGTTASNVTVAGSAGPTVNAVGAVTNVVSTSTGTTSVTGTVSNVAATDTNNVTTAATVAPITITLESIAITTYPVKLTYAIGQSLDPTGLVVTGTYSVMGFSGMVTMVETILPGDISGFSSATSGTKVVTITKNSKTAIFPVTVVNKEVNLITVKTLPTKLTYEINSSLEAAGGAINVIYTDANLYPNEIKAMDGAGVSVSCDTTSVGNKIATVTYGGRSVTYVVAVKNSALEALTAAKLDAEKAINDLYASKIKTDYTTENWNRIAGARAVGILAVRDSASISAVDSEKTSALAAINAVKTIEQESLASADAFRSKYAGVLAKTVSNIAMSDKAAVNAAIMEYNTFTSNVKSKLTTEKALLDSLLAKINLMEASQTLDAARTSAKIALEAAYNNYSSGYTTNHAAIEAAKNTGMSRIDAAVSVAEAISAKDAAIAAMAAYKSDAQIAAEALAAAKTSAVNQINAAFNTYSQSSYTKNWTVLINARDVGISKINAALIPSEVTVAKDAAITAMANVKSDAQLTAEELAAAKTKAKAELNSYKNLADYRTAQQTEITNARSTGCSNIDAATTVANVNTALSTAKANIAAIKTDAQLKSEELAAAKRNAVNELNSYKAKTDYSDTNWNIILQKKQTGITIIESSTTTGEVVSALAAAKADIDVVKTIAQENQTAAVTFKTVYSAMLAKTVDTIAKEDKAAVNAALSAYAALPSGAKALLTSEKALLDSLLAKIGELETLQLAQYKAQKVSELNSYANAKGQSNYSVANWTALQGYVTSGTAAINNAANSTAVDNAFAVAKTSIDGVKTITQPSTVLYSSSRIAVGAVNPSIVVNLTNDTFKESGISGSMGNWSFSATSTGLSISTITRDSDTQLTIRTSGTAKAGSLTLRAKAEALSGGIESNTITLFVLPEAAGTAGTIRKAGAMDGILIDGIVDAVNASPSINGQEITFHGEIAYYQANESNSLPISANWIGVKITAPDGVTPDGTAMLYVNGRSLNEEPGWENIRMEGDGNNYFYLFQRVTDLSRVYRVTIKWNESLTESYTIDFAGDATLEAPHGGIELDGAINGGADAGVTIEDQWIKVAGAIDYYKAEESNGLLREDGNYVGVKITAPEGVVPDGNAVLTANGTVVDTGWDSFGITGNGVYYFNLYQKVTQTAFVYEVQIKWNEEVTETYSIYIPRNATLKPASENQPPPMVLYSSSKIAVDEVNPIIVVNLMNDTFKESGISGSAGNWAFSDAGSGLAVSTIERISDTQVIFHMSGTAQTGSFTLKAKAVALAGGHESNTITVFVLPEAAGTAGTIEKAGAMDGILIDGVTDAVNASPSINGLGITFHGEIAYYQANESNSLPISANWIGVKITAPDGVTPDGTAMLYVNGRNLNEEPGWVNIRMEGDGDNYFHLFQRVTDLSRVYRITIKWNESLTESYTIDFASDATLEAPHGGIELDGAINGGADAGVTIEDQWIKVAGAIDYYKAEESNGLLAEDGNYVGIKITAPEGVVPNENAVLTAYGTVVGTGWDSFGITDNGVHYFNLYQKVTQTAFVYEVQIKWNDEVTETYNIHIRGTATLKPANDNQPPTVLYSSSKIAADAVNPSIVVNLINDTFKESGISDIVDNWSFSDAGSGLAINTITRDSDTQVTINLIGTTQAGATFTLKANAEALTGGHESNTITVFVLPEAAGTAGTIDTADAINGILIDGVADAENAGPTINGQKITFNGEIAYYQANASNGLPISGNWIGVKITAPEDVTPDDATAMLYVNGRNCNFNEAPGWDNIKAEGDGDNYFHLFQRVTDLHRVYHVVIKWNDNLTESYIIDFAGDATLEAPH